MQKVGQFSFKSKMFKWKRMFLLGHVYDFCFVVENKQQLYNKVINTQNGWEEATLLLHSGVRAVISMTQSSKYLSQMGRKSIQMLSVLVSVIHVYFLWELIIHVLCLSFPKIVNYSLLGKNSKIFTDQIMTIKKINSMKH